MGRLHILAKIAKYLAPTEAGDCAGGVGHHTLFIKTMVTIELATQRRYDRVEQQDEEASEQSEAVSERPASQTRQEAERSATSPTSSSSSSRSRSTARYISAVSYDDSPTAAIDRIMLNLLFMCFLLSMTFVYGGAYVYVPFLIGPPNSPSAATLPHNHAPSFSFTHRPPVYNRPTGRVANTCPPPAASNGTILTSSFFKRVRKSEGNDDGMYLSRDASILVLTDSHHPTKHCTNSCKRGQIRTFGWDCETQSYEFLSNLNGKQPFQRMGKYVQLSDNGEVMAVESNGHVSIHQWNVTRWVTTLRHISLYPSDKGLGDEFQKFSMNTDGTIMAALTLVTRTGIIVTLCEWDGQGWHETVYSGPIPGNTTHGEPLAISMSEDGTTISIFGVRFGILRAALSNEEIVPLEDSRLALFPQDELDEDPRGNWNSYSVSVFENDVLYAHSSTGNHASVNIAAYHGAEWNTIYNATWIPRLNVELKRTTALLYREGQTHFALLTKHGHKWHLLTKDRHHSGIIVRAAISGDGRFLCVLDEYRDLQLYSINSTGVD